MTEILFKELSYAIIGAATPAPARVPGACRQSLVQVLVWRCTASSAPAILRQLRQPRISGPEAVYQAALEYELTLRGIPFEAQKRLAVFYKGRLAGEYIADIVVDGQIILELKAISALTKAHEAQAHNYPSPATGLRLAILLNFGAASLQRERVVKKETRGPGDEILTRITRIRRIFPFLPGRSESIRRIRVIRVRSPGESHPSETCHEVHE